MEMRTALVLSLLKVVPGCVVSLEVNVKFDELTWLQQAIGRLLFSRARLVSVLSESDKGTFERVFQLPSSKVAVLHQWAQCGPFPERESESIRNCIASSFGEKFVVVAGRSSRNWDELFTAMDFAPPVRCVTIGLDPACVPPRLRPRVISFQTLPFEEYIWILRRAQASIIPLRAKDHTAGVRVWFQSVALGIPASLTATAPVLEYVTRLPITRTYLPGNPRDFASRLLDLWEEPSPTGQERDERLGQIPEALSPIGYDRNVRAILRSLARSSYGDHGPGFKSSGFADADTSWQP